MGNLHYGSKVVLELNDFTLFHLELLLDRMRDRSFSLHATVSGQNDGNLLSMRISPGVELWMEFYNDPEFRIDDDLLTEITERAMRIGIVSLPFVPSDQPDPRRPVRQP